MRISKHSTGSTASVEEFDEEDTGTNNDFDISTAISGANSGKMDEPSFLLLVDYEKLAVQAKLQGGCGCPHDCYKQFSEDKVYLICLLSLKRVSVICSLR